MSTTVQKNNVELTFIKFQNISLVNSARKFSAYPKKILITLLRGGEMDCFGFEHDMNTKYFKKKSP
jgi:hypothetical protein